MHRCGIHSHPQFGCLNGVILNLRPLVRISYRLRLSRTSQRSNEWQRNLHQRCRQRGIVPLQNPPFLGHLWRSSTNENQQAVLDRGAAEKRTQPTPVGSRFPKFPQHRQTSTGYGWILPFCMPSTTLVVFSPKCSTISATICSPTRRLEDSVERSHCKMRGACIICWHPRHIHTIGCDCQSTEVSPRPAWPPNPLPSSKRSISAPMLIVEYIRTPTCDCRCQLLRARLTDADPNVLKIESRPENPRQSTLEYDSRYSSKTSRAVLPLARVVLDQLVCVPTNRSLQSRGSANKTAVLQSPRVLALPDRNIRVPESHPSRLHCANRGVHTIHRGDNHWTCLKCCF